MKFKELSRKTQEILRRKAAQTVHQGPDKFLSIFEGDIIYMLLPISALLVSKNFESGLLSRNSVLGKAAEAPVDVIYSQKQIHSIGARIRELARTKQDYGPAPPRK
ncbi:MAG: hypothetical protein QGH40_00650 [bacterium]|nr:hypothetical protein [bacterium]